MKKNIFLMLLLSVMGNAYAMMLPSMDVQTATPKGLQSKRFEKCCCDSEESLLRKQEEKLRKKEARQRRLEKKQQENALRSRHRRSRKKSKRQTPESWATLECEPNLLLEDSCLSDNESSDSDQSDSEISESDIKFAGVKRVTFGGTEIIYSSDESGYEGDQVVCERDEESYYTDEKVLESDEEHSDGDEEEFFVGEYYDDLEDSLLRKREKRGFEECKLPRKEKDPKKSKRRVPKSWVALESDNFGDEKTYKQLEELVRCFKILLGELKRMCG